MSKRGADGQGDKTTGSIFDTGPDETPVKASAAQMAGRRVLSAKSRRGGGSSFTSGSSLQSLGNPFAASPTSSAPTTNNNTFAQSPTSNGFSFGAPAQSNSTPAFGSQSASFPPAQTTNTSIFGGSSAFTPPTGGFSFNSGSTSNPNPFSQNKAPSFGVGQSNGFGAAQAQSMTQQDNASGDGMQISPPTSPEKSGLGVNTATPSIFGAISGSQPPKASFTFGQPAGQPQSTASQPLKNSFTFGQPGGQSQSTATEKTTSNTVAPTFSFGSSQQTFGQKPPSFGFSSKPQDAVPSPTESQRPESPNPSATSTSITTPAASPFPASAGFSFGQPAQATSAQPSASASASSLFQNTTSGPFKGFGSSTPAAPSQSASNDLYPRLSNPSDSSTPAPSFGSSLFPKPAQQSEAQAATPAAHPFANIFKSQTPSVALAAAQSTPAQTTQTPSAGFGAAAQTAPLAAPPAAEASLESASAVQITRTAADPSADFSEDSEDLDDDLAVAYQTQVQIRRLNLAFRSNLAAADEDIEWAGFAAAYISAYEKIARSAAEGSQTAELTGKRKADEDLAGESVKRSRPIQPAASPAPASVQNTTGRSQTATLFQNILDKKDTAEPTTPAKPAANFSAPSTTPAGPPPSTNLFSNFKPAPSVAPTPSLFAAKPAAQQLATPQTKSFENAAPNPFAAIKAPVAASPAPAPSSLFSVKPSSASAVLGFTPSAPKTSAPTSSATNFMAQFGSKAAKDAEKQAAEAKAKAKAEEFDSEEDDEDEWERNYEEEQAKKKAESAKATFQLPKFGAAPSAGSNTFLSQFGANAVKNAEKMAAEEKAKRKAEEFDSDEDDAEEWERKYEEEQRQKKAKLEQAKTSGGFTFGSTTSSKPAETATAPAAQAPTSKRDSSVFSAFSDAGAAPASSNIFGHLSNTVSENPSDNEETDYDPEEEEEPEESADAEESAAQSETANSSSGRLFGRVTPAETSEEEMSKAPTTSTADHTWKVDSPIKFSASATPAFKFTPPVSSTPSTLHGTENTAPASTSRVFGGLFSSQLTKTDTTPSLFGSSFKPTPAPASAPNVGFSFGGPSSTFSAPVPSLFANLGANSPFASQATSRASSPGIPPSVADSAEGDAEDDAEPAAPQTDLTSLTDDEKREEDILFEVEKARASIFIKGDAQPWQTRGTGPLRVLRNKESGVVRILLRAAPSGKVVLNSRLNKGFTYSHAGKGTARLMAAGQGGKLETWAVKMARDEDVGELVGVCEREKSA